MLQSITAAAGMHITDEYDALLPAVCRLLKLSSAIVTTNIERCKTLAEGGMVLSDTLPGTNDNMTVCKMLSAICSGTQLKRAMDNYYPEGFVEDRVLTPNALNELLSCLRTWNTEQAKVTIDDSSRNKEGQLDCWKQVLASMKEITDNINIVKLRVEDTRLEKSRKVLHDLHELLKPIAGGCTDGSSWRGPEVDSADTIEAVYEQACTSLMNRDGMVMSDLISKMALAKSNLAKELEDFGRSSSDDQDIQSANELLTRARVTKFEALLLAIISNKTVDHSTQARRLSGQFCIMDAEEVDMERMHPLIVGTAQARSIEAP